MDYEDRLRSIGFLPLDGGRYLAASYLTRGSCAYVFQSSDGPRVLLSLIPRYMAGITEKMVVEAFYQYLAGDDDENSRR